MNIHEGKKFIDSEAVTIVDIRDEESYKQGHIKSAVFLNDENLKSFLKETNKDTPLLCYCYHGHSSKSAAEFFKENGFKTVYSLDGGFEAWKIIYPSERSIQL